MDPLPPFRLTCQTSFPGDVSYLLIAEGKVFVTASDFSNNTDTAALRGAGVGYIVNDDLPTKTVTMHRVEQNADQRGVPPRRWSTAVA
jgi:hypothetical protein